MSVTKHTIYKFYLDCGVCGAQVDGGTGEKVSFPMGWRYVWVKSNFVAGGSLRDGWNRLHCPTCPDA